MTIYYDGWGGYMIGDYHINEDGKNYCIRTDLDSSPIFETVSFQKAVNWCLEQD